jgi:four helix bundle protein
LRARCDRNICHAAKTVNGKNCVPGAATPLFSRQILGMRSAHAGVMSKPFTYRDLVVWKLGMDLVERCYKATASFPKSELYGLTAQLRRACVSIPSNIAEGHGTRSTKAYMNHVSIAIGSQAELTTCLELAASWLSEAKRARPHHERERLSWKAFVWSTSRLKTQARGTSTQSQPLKP